MNHNRMDAFRVAIDPRTGELRGTSRTWGPTRGLRATRGGFNWKPLVYGCAVVLALMVAVFAVAVVSELM